jgi:osmotically-inducible protein OsmY
VTWVVRAPDRELERGEKKVYSRVRRVLWDYEPLRASHAEIFIDVDGSNIRLRGRVRTSPQKLIAAMLVERMAEVGAVTNDLIADPDVIRSVADALAQDDRTAPYVIRVDSRHGIITLTGEVPTPEVEQAAIDIASGVPLVLTVRDKLTIGGETLPPVSLPRRSAAVANVDATPAAAESAQVPA